MSSPTSYERLVRRLYRTNLYNPVKLGLNNIENLAQALNSPFYTKENENSTNATSAKTHNNGIGIIHIAGTNGKGSVSYKIAESLRLSGYKTGLFVSPHISSFRERVQINGACIPESEVNTILTKIFNACESENIPATFFEITTALALEYFSHSHVDAIVLETGLGGRLDSTNLVLSDLSVITSIGLEHTRILGDTKELIASEKAGIFKPNRPALVGVDVPFPTIKSEAEKHGVSTLHTISSVLGSSISDQFLEKDFDEQNSYVAKSALKIARTTPAFKLMEERGLTIKDEAVEAGCAQRPPCRFEEKIVTTPHGSVNIILDVAHNPPALFHLFDKLSKQNPGVKKRVVIGMSSDKDLKLCGEILTSNVENVDNIHLVEASHPRAAKIQDMIEKWEELKGSNYDINDASVEKQTRTALKLAQENNELLIVCGSVFLMAGARSALGYNEPRDSDFVAKEAGANLRKDLQEHFGNRVWSEDEESEGETEREFEEFLEGALSNAIPKK
ncbi:hypothetical protein TrLO_g1141 [Triparma laevis f. longispina]|nr:hypothetical protein TrLO_g1141 [Triparma laevis f. longispina]